MKTIYLAFSLFIVSSLAIAQDLTFTTLNTATGMSTGSIDLSVSGGVAPYTFSWTGPTGYTAITEDIGGLTYGNYTVTVTDKYCGIATMTVFVDNDIASGINEIEENVITIFPNPATESVSLSAESSLTNARFRLINIAGQTVLEQKEIGGNVFVFDVSPFSPGIYFVEIADAGYISRTRFVKN
ncbi:MAG TPA: T9SS type A sorting domain-containing protein [Bacteroidia bacterium]|jgi:hypothetical protein